MSNWAIVIGVDKYWRPEACLAAAVGDALSMRSWLLDVEGGNVPLSNLTLLLSPATRGLPSGVAASLADQQNIIESIERLLDRSGGEGERLFFYFAGHGLMPSTASSSAILPSDFTDVLTNRSLTVFSLLEVFQSTRFKEQFFFVDACRNMPFDFAMRLGEYPIIHLPTPPVSPQFVMYATQPGSKSVEVNNPGDEQGAFTGALLNGLVGTGQAKQWDPGAGDYVVRWNSLFAHVESTVKALKHRLEERSAPPLIQEPRQHGERPAFDPILGRVPLSKVLEEVLEIDLEPAAVSGVARLSVGEFGSVTHRREPPIEGLPLTFTLPPRMYGVSASAPGYRMRGGAPWQIVELYAPSSVRVELVADGPPSFPAPVSGSAPGPQSTAAPPSPAPSAPGGSPQASASDGAAGTEVVSPSARGTIAISSSDAFAQVVLADASGRIIEVGRSRLQARDQSPGFYRARLVSPEGRVTEQLLELPVAGGDVAVALTAQAPMSPAMKWASSTGQFGENEDGTLQPSETVGNVAFLKLSTVLALAAGASLEGTTTSYGRKLRSLGIPRFTFPSGVMLLLGDEMLAPDCWSGSELDAVMAGGSGGFAPSIEEQPNVPGIASSQMPLSAGAYVFTLSWNRGESKLAIPTVVLPNRVSLLVVTRESDGTLELHQYQPLAAPNDNRDFKARDPFFGGSYFAALRRIEVMQRSAASGRITPTLPDIDLLLSDKWVDPVAGCLGAYLLIRMGRTQELDVPTRNLTTFFGELPDAHVLRAVYLKATGQTGEAFHELRKGLDLALPLYRDGLVLLVASLSEFPGRLEGLEQAKQLLMEIPSGSLWTARPYTEGNAVDVVELEAILEAAHEAGPEAADDAETEAADEAKPLTRGHPG